jgi:hypothetical protein
VCLAPKAESGRRDPTIKDDTTTVSANCGPFTIPQITWPKDDNSLPSSAPIITHQPATYICIQGILKPSKCSYPNTIIISHSWLT